MKQPSLWHVLQPKWRTALQRLREERDNGGYGKIVIITLVGSLFWAAVPLLLGLCCCAAPPSSLTSNVPVLPSR